MVPDSDGNLDGSFWIQEEEDTSTGVDENVKTKVYSDWETHPIDVTTTTTSYSDWETHPIDVTTTTTSYSDWETHSSDNDGNIALSQNSTGNVHHGNNALSQNSTGNVHHALINRMVLVEETVSPDCTTHATIMESLEGDVSKGGATEEIPSDAFHQPTEDIPADAFHQPRLTRPTVVCFLFRHDRGGYYNQSQYYHQ
jgi:hypothetical protein